jgi:hypothetical protein
MADPAFEGSASLGKKQFHISFEPLRTLEPTHTLGAGTIGKLMGDFDIVATYVKLKKKTCRGQTFMML